MYIPDANTMWQTQNNHAAFDKACASVLREIEKAREAGRRWATFYPYPYEQYEAVKAAFVRKGYYFTPTGYIGGVWQQSERINW